MKIWDKNYNGNLNQNQQKKYSDHKIKIRHRKLGFFGGNQFLNPTKSRGYLKNAKGSLSGPRAQRAAQWILEIPDGLP